MKNIHPETKKEFDEWWQINEAYIRGFPIGKLEAFISTHFTDKRIIEDEIEKYPHICGACSEKVSNLSHTLACQMKKHLKQSLLKDNEENPSNN